ncbi:DUF397 domain-containing protein [Streptomyces niveus]|uniref:DUF397 domain-containing protein n=2 Tax=Streptomyces niveus TaxID=193462 RepID=UPI0003C634EF|nr:DUF397 domain-containing protein [Streptomyces niveus]EST26143.1 hypothetical protein M877_19590 [Streptomyces niveus NCIMB 11891]
MTNTPPTVLTWTKSSYSGGNNDCLEVAHGTADALPVRDSKRPTGPTLTIPHTAWTTFITSVKTTELA